MPCPRCDGLMILEQFEDIWDDTEQTQFRSRCLICGEILDPLILVNRMTAGSSLVR